MVERGPKPNIFRPETCVRTYTGESSTELWLRWVADWEGHRSWMREFRRSEHEASSQAEVYVF